MKKFFIIFGALLIAQASYALEVVYPKTSPVTINSPSTFFVGSAGSYLIINGHAVPVHKSGGFAYPVKLNYGKNKFVLKSDGKIINFEITRPQIPASTATPPKLVEYSENKYFETSSDNVPLRQTPEDFGINRISHFEKGIPLIVDGEQNNFYRVVLAPNQYAWIAKSNVTPSNNTEQAKVLGYDYIDSPEYFTFVFHLSQKTPYSIAEGETFTLKFFNVKESGTYEFDFPYSEAAGTKKLVGYSGKFKGNDFVFKVRKFPKNALKGITIAVDAGHGGDEYGAIGCLGDKEKDINLKIAKYLEKELEKRGAKVVMTRTDDTNKDLYKRVEKANENDAMFLISIHANALPDSSNPLEHRGTSVYYYYNQAKLLSAYILSEINAQTFTQNDEIRQGSLALVRNTNALSVLVETAYLINPDDNAKLINDEFQRHCAKAIADGIEKFLKK